jgi:hypothetical protein
MLSPSSYAVPFQIPKAVSVAATSAANKHRLVDTLMKEAAETTEAAWTEDARCDTGATP